MELIYILEHLFGVYQLYFFFGALYGVVLGRVLLELNYSVPYIIDSCNSCYSNATFTSSTWLSICPSSNNMSLYKTYHTRLLMLSSDVELNPGPTDTERILAGINEIKEDVGSLKNEVLGIKSSITKIQTELTCMKGDVKTLNTKVSKIEQTQTQLKSDITKLNQKVDQLDYSNEMMNTDMAYLSQNDERKMEQIEHMEKLIDIIDGDRVKSSMRIFGIDEGDDDTKSMKTIIKEKVFVHTNMEDGLTEDSILFAKRVGTKKPGTARMVLVKFKSEDDKFKLFGYRNILRTMKIRISSELTYNQRQQIKDAKDRGLAAYFKGGKLVVNEQSNRTYRKAVRRRGQQEPNNNNTGDDMDVGAQSTDPDVQTQ